MLRTTDKPARVNFIFGEEDFRREEEIARISAFVSELAEAEIISLDAADAGVSEAIGEAMTGSLFSRARHVVVRRAEELKAADAKALVASLTEGQECPLPDGTYVSVGWAERKFPPQGLKLPKSAGWVALKECKKVYERDAREFALGFARSRGMELSEDAVSALLTRLGTDLSLISSEVEKLITYLGSGAARATGQDVRRAIGEAAHEGLGDLITAVASGDASRAMHLVRQFRESSDPRIPNQLMLAALASELRLMLAMQEKLASGRTTLETVREIKAEREIRTPEFILERTVNMARRLGADKAVRMLVRLGSADRQMKGGTALTDTALGEDESFESAVIDLCALALR